MEKHVCYDKLTKKKRREIDLKKRGSWLGVNPVTRRPEDRRCMVVLSELPEMLRLRWALMEATLVLMVMAMVKFL